MAKQTFDTAAALEAWTRSVGAQTGDGPEATIEWDAGAVHFVGTDDTRVWPMLSREVPVDGRWLEVRGTIRTAGVDPSRARYPNCNLIVKTSAGVVPTRVVMGDQPATPVVRRIELPDGATTATVGFFLSMPGEAWFDDVEVRAIEGPAWLVTKEAGHPYAYSTLGDDRIGDDARAFNDAAVRDVAAFLDVDVPSEPLRYFKYPDLDTKEALTGVRGNAHRDGRDIHSIWPTDRHEIVHVLADAWGDPPALLGEGLAVHLSGGWQGGSVKAAAAELLGSDDWVEPTAILDTRVFRAKGDASTYPVSGAFVEWIVATKGKSTLRALYGALQNTAPVEDNRAALDEALGPDVDEAFRAWLEAS